MFHDSIGASQASKKRKKRSTTLIPDRTSHLMSTSFEEEVGHEFGIVWHEFKGH